MAVGDVGSSDGHGNLVPLASIADVREADWMGAIYHKDLLPVTYVTADMAGEIDSPLYGMFRMVSLLNEQEQAPRHTGAIPAPGCPV